MDKALPQAPRNNGDLRHKICSIEELGQIAREARASGRSVVLAHGVFDLLHIGHIYHLQEARAAGDVLIVTLTADQHVNKGPGRPVFPGIVRAEMLAALEFVDFVGINDATGAEALLHAVRPSIYFKGEEYSDSDKDVTGRIVSEREAVEAHGGELKFSQGPVYSSSALLNRYFDIYDPGLRDYLEEMRTNPNILKVIVDAIESIANQRVLLIGDAIIDEYNYVHAMGKAGKENIIASRFLSRERFAGGVFAAANHVASFCREVEIITCIGTDPSHEELIRQHLKPNVKLRSIARSGVETTRKSRTVDRSYFRKISEIYFADDRPLPEDLRQQFKEVIKQHAGGFDTVVVSDFGHGLITGDTVESILENSRFVGVNTQTNSANFGYNLITRYPSASYVCIDAPEAHLAMGDKYADIETIAARLAERIDCSDFIVTRGEQGCLTYQRGGAMRKIPAFTKTVVDTMGAGDAFLSVTSPLISGKVPIDLVGFIGNAVGALKVGIVGHRASVEKPALIKYISALLK